MPAHNKISIESIIGEKFGMLTILNEAESFVDKGGQKRRMVNCLCDCGNTKSVNFSNLKRGKLKSCGCYNRAKLRERFSTHNKSHTRLYEIWGGMKKRCNNPQNHAYKYYGGRGIKVCEEWLDDFQNFYDWSMANGYKEELEIDRIDNDSNYEPTNCRWVTRKVNNHNRSITKLTAEEAQDIRNARLLNCFSVKEISIAYGISQVAVYNILNNKTWV